MLVHRPAAFIFASTEMEDAMTMHEQITPSAVEVHIVRDFISGDTGGNPASVVLDADDLSEADMQSIAARTGTTETAFVSRSANEGARLDFFTPNRRIPP